MTIRKKQIDDLILRREYPKTFFLFERRRVPLKLRIDQDLHAALDPAIDRRLSGRALWHYTNNLFYRMSQRVGRPRFDLDGNVAGSVSEECRERRSNGYRPQGRRRSEEAGSVSEGSGDRASGAARMIEFITNDGGREAAGFKGEAGDCVCRAITIATGKPYAEVYAALWDGLREHAATKRDKVARRIAHGGGRKGTTPRNGVSRKVYGVYLQSLGFVWTPTMQIGSGCKVHLRADELPSGRLIVSLANHVAAVIDGVLHDTFDSSGDGTRCVYGYWRLER